MVGHGRPCAAMTRPGLAMVGHGWSLLATHPTRCTRDDFPRRVYMSIVPVQFTHIRNVFQVSILFTSQLVLNMCLDYNNLVVRTNEKPPYIYIYIYIYPPAPTGHTAVKLFCSVLLSSVISSQSLSYVLCPLSSVLSSVLCPMSYVLCYLFSVLCPRSSVLCPLFSVAKAGFWYLIEAVRGLGHVRIAAQSPPKT